MAPYNLILFAVTILFFFSGGFNFQAAARSVNIFAASPESGTYASGPGASSSLPPVSEMSAVHASASASAASTESGKYAAVPTSGPTASSSLAPVAGISAAPASAPIGFQTISAVSAPGPAPVDIDIDFDEVINVADIAPKFQHIHNFDFSDMKIDTTAKDLCNSTDYTNECIAAILPDLQKRADEGKTSADPEDVLRMEAHSLFKKANATLQYAKRVKNNGSTEESVKEAMSVCVQNYDSLLSDLEDARKAMESGDYFRLESVLSAAISDVSTCSDSFGEVPGVDSPTASLDDFMRKLCSNILAMSQQIKHHR